MRMQPLHTGSEPSVCALLWSQKVLSFPSMEQIVCKHDNTADTVECHGEKLPVASHTRQLTVVTENVKIRSVGENSSHTREYLHTAAAMTRAINQEYAVPQI